MAFLETEARTALLANFEVTDAVGDRIYLGAAPQDATRPYIVIACDAQERLPVHGARNSQTQGVLGIVEYIDVATYANEYGVARALEANILTTLEGVITDSSNSPWTFEDWSMTFEYETQSGADQKGWENIVTFKVFRKQLWLPPS
jgi:hypothetical protein